MGLMRRAAELAGEVGPERNRYADFVRLVAIVAVVVGHWTVIDVRVDDGTPEGINALAESGWIHWGTWAFQVIPLFFLVGGYANAASWRAHHERGHDWASWLRRRAVRLLWPTAIFVTAGLMLTPLAALWDVPTDILSQAAWAVAIILWFLAVYAVIASLTPLAMRAHRRGGWGVVALLFVLVVITDSIRFLGGTDLFAQANFALVWGAFHQIGFLWKDGMLPSLRGILTVIVVCLAALFALVVWGPYPVSMVSVPGAEVQNTSPPTLALLLVGMAQISVALGLRGVMIPKLEGTSRLWTVVVAGNLVIMSIFLWHVVPVLAVAGSLAAIGLSTPGPPGSMQWLAFRPVWTLMLAALLIPIIGVVSRAERPPELLERVANRQGPRKYGIVLGLVGIVAASAGLARLTLEGFWAGASTVIPVWGAAGFFVGSALAIGSGLLGRTTADEPV